MATGGVPSPALEGGGTGEGEEGEGERGPGSGLGLVLRANLITLVVATLGVVRNEANGGLKGRRQLLVPLKTTRLRLFS